MAGLAGALVLNIGTLSRPGSKSMRRAAGAAEARGSRSSSTRSERGPRATGPRPPWLLREYFRPAVIRGNASEIRASGPGRSGDQGGRQPPRASDAALDAARVLAERFGARSASAVAVDIIVGGQGLIRPPTAIR